MIERYTLKKMGDIWTEENKFSKWLEVEVLACEALSKKGKVHRKSIETIKQKAGFSVERINEIESRVHHDTIAFVTSVQEHIGPEGRYIHMGLTSSDVVDTALSSLIKEATELLINDIKGLIDAVTEKAKKYKRTIMVGRSHGVHAEPTTLGLKFALMREELKRAEKRLKRAREVISYGKISGAVGTYAHIEPSVEEYVCKKMGLNPSPISTQVIQRDRHAEYMDMLALVGSSLERWAQEIRALQRTEIRELEEPFRKGQKGSSAMPHKRNPVVCERICGLARVIRGYAMTAGQNVALWHERDISHSSTERIIVPDATILLDYMLNKMTDIINDLHVYPERMKENLAKTKGLIFSQKVMLKMVGKGLSRDDAYKIVQENAMRVWSENSGLMELLLTDERVKQKLSEQEIKECFSEDAYISNVDLIFKRLGIK